MTSKKMHLLIELLHIPEKNWSPKPHLQPCTSPLSAPDVRFKLAVLSIALDISLHLIIGKLRK